MHGKNKRVKIAAVGDIHTHHGNRGFFRELFAEISGAADILLLCGDLTNSGLPEEAAVLADNFAALDIPVLGVLGNHDHQHDKTEEIKQILSGAGMVLLEDQNFEFKGLGFAGTKGFGGGFGNHMLVSYGERAVKTFVGEAVNESLKLENNLRSLDTKKNVVVLHYSPVIATVRGESPEIFPFLGCSRLAETIDRFNISAVFHGHVHHGQAIGQTKKGIPVYNCCFELLKHKQNRHPYVLMDIG